MSNFVPGLKLFLSYFEKLEGGVRKSNGIEVEARYRLLDVAQGIKELVSLYQR